MIFLYVIAGWATIVMMLLFLWCRFWTQANHVPAPPVIYGGKPFLIRSKSRPVVQTRMRGIR